MLYVTIGVITLLIAIAFALHYMSPMLAEVSDRFLPIVIAAFFIVLGAGVYLSFAVPSLAGGNPYAQKDGAVFRDTVKGLPFEE